MIKTIDVTEDFLRNKYFLDDEDISFIKKYNILWCDESNNSEFVNSPLKDYSKSNAFGRSILIERVKYKNVTPLLLADLCYRLKNNKNIIALAFSDTGLGKSYYFIMFCLIINDYCRTVLKYKHDVFNVENVAFNVDEYLQIGEGATRNFCLFNDEEDLERFGIGSTINNAQYDRFQQLMRSQQFHHFSCSPKMRNWVFHHYAVEMIGICKEKGLSAGVWLGNETIPNPIGLVILPNPCDYAPELMRLYEEKKKLNQELFRKRELGNTTKIKWLDCAIRIIKEGGYYKFKGKIHKKDLDLTLNSLYPRAFGLREQDLIINMADCFLKNKPMLEKDKEYMHKNITIAEH